MHAAGIYKTNCTCTLSSFSPANSTFKVYILEK
jgi:hypothetical protein